MIKRLDIIVKSLKTTGFHMHEGTYMLKITENTLKEITPNVNSGCIRSLRL